MYPQYPMYNPMALQMPQYQQQMQMPMAMQQQQQIRPAQNNNSSIIRVQNENEARCYPVEPGKSITFKDDNAPYIYTKTMDSSQLGEPSFEKFRLVKEDEADDEVKVAAPDYTEDFEQIKEDIKFIKEKLSDADRRKKTVAKGGEQNE